MKITRIEREITYLITDADGNDHRYTISNSSDKGKGNVPTTYICGDHEGEEIEVPTAELPFLIKSLKLFLSDYSTIKNDNV